MAIEHLTPHHPEPDALQSVHRAPGDRAIIELRIAETCATAALCVAEFRSDEGEALRNLLDAIEAHVAEARAALDQDEEAQP